jgi:hypothetical protein
MGKSNQGDRTETGGIRSIGASGSDAKNSVSFTAYAAMKWLEFRRLCLCIPDHFTFLSHQ